MIGVQTTTSLTGNEYVEVDLATSASNGAVIVQVKTQTIANLGTSGGTATTTLIGTEVMPVQTVGGVQEKITAANFNIWAVASGTLTATIVGTEIDAIQTAGGVAEKITTLTNYSVTPNATSSFTTSAQSNSTSVTLTAVFTALTFTQTSTGNTVNLKAAPVDGEIQGLSMTNIVTNLTVSSAANTVTNGAVGTTVAGQALWWRFNASNTTWYKYN
jgi:hypothetical protein